MDDECRDESCGFNALQLRGEVADRTPLLLSMGKFRTGFCVYIYNYWWASQSRRCSRAQDRNCGLCMCICCCYCFYSFSLFLLLLLLSLSLLIMHCDRKGGPFRRRCTVDTVDTKIRVNCVNCARKIHPKFVSTVSIISPKIHPKFIQPFFKLQQPKMMGHRPSHPPIICCIYFMYCPWISRVHKWLTD